MRTGGDGGGGGGGVAAGTDGAFGRDPATAVCLVPARANFFLCFCLTLPFAVLPPPPRPTRTGDLPDTSASRFFDTEDLGGTFVHCLDPRLRKVRLAFLFVPAFPLRDESSIFVAVGVAEPCGSGTVVTAEGTAPLCCSFCRARWSISSKESC